MKLKVKKELIILLHIFWALFSLIFVIIGMLSNNDKFLTIGIVALLVTIPFSQKGKVARIVASRKLTTVKARDDFI